MIPSGHSLFRQDLDEIVAGLAPLWDRLEGASILITGGTGFFGMWLVEGLLWANEVLDLGLQLTVLSRNRAGFLAGRGRHLAAHPALTVADGDVARFDPGERRFTHIIHAVTQGDVDHSALSHLDAALAGTRRIIDIASDHGTAAVLLTSSGAVYRQVDPQAPGRSREGPAGPADYTSFRPVYAEAKRAMESLLAAGAEHHGFRAAIARCFAFAGAWLPVDGGLAMGNFVRDALAGRAIAVGGDGSALRSYLYGTDLVIWLMTVLLKGENCRPYNVGGAEAVSIGDLAHLVAAQTGRPGNVAIAATPPPGAVPDAYLPDLSRITAELGVEATVALPEAVRRMLDWYRERGA